MTSRRRGWRSFLVTACLYVTLHGNSANAASVQVPAQAPAQAQAQAQAQDYTRDAVAAIRALNDGWYDVKTGIWNSAWWNSANALTTLADFASVRLFEANQLNIGGYIRNTFIQAQKTDVTTSKSFSAYGMVKSVDCLDRNSGCMAKRAFLGKRGFADFLNEFYDDEGWWALALIRAFDVSTDREYLRAAVDVFDDMSTGQGTPCGGGIYWSKKRTYVNAIANELYLSVATSLALRLPQNETYRRIALEHWTWFDKSGMINQQNLINDGLDNSCKNNGLQTWSYNQGVVLGGLADLFRLTGDRRYVERAFAIARAAIQAFSDAKGILAETDKCELRPGNCGADGAQFKGVFMRNLRYLNQVAPQQDFRDFILRNAESIWQNDRNDQNRLGVAWTGPFVAASAASHSSALDTLVAAIAVL